MIHPSPSLQRVMQGACWITLVLLATAACAPLETPTVALTPAPTVPVTITALPTRAPAATLTSTPVPTPTPAPIQVYFAPGIPSDALDLLRQPFGSASASVRLTQDERQADIIFTTTAALSHTVAAEWVYAVAVPFPTFADAVTSTWLIRFWDGQPDALKPVTNNSATPVLFVTADTLRALTAFFGRAPAPGAPIQVTPQDKLVDAVWAARPASFAIVPFDQLDPRLKVLSLDGVSLLHRNGNNHYWLTLRVLVSARRGQELIAPLLRAGPLTNRNEARMTLLAMTGVTALSRDFAWVMDRQGVLYPDQKIKSWLTDADVVHISNEVAFNAECAISDLVGTGDMALCSKPGYLDLLRDVQARVIESTGNHLNDYGWQPFSYTLSLYQQAGLAYFGGGRTITEAQRAITLTDHGNVLGFVGCNPVGPPIAWVNGLNDGRPGAAPCPSPYSAMQKEIARLRAAGAVAIATLQYDEQPLGAYAYEVEPIQRDDFRRLADAGANIVSGSQAHHPQGFDLYRGAFIHHGPGNLFFDQTQTLGMRQLFVDRYLIYQGRVLSVELLTGIRDVDNWAQPRPMTAAERRAFLDVIFKASGW